MCTKVEHLSVKKVNPRASEKCYKLAWSGWTCVPVARHILPTRNSLVIKVNNRKDFERELGRESGETTSAGLHT